MSSILVANSIYKLSFNLRSMLVSQRPWSRKKCSAVKCLMKDRGYTSSSSPSSIPVRYVPKKLRDVDKSETISRNNNDRKDHSISFDKAKMIKINTSISREPEDVAKEMQVNDVCKEDERFTPSTTTSKEAAENIILELLATRQLTVVELRKRLSEKSFPCSIVEEVILDLKNRLKNHGPATLLKDGSNSLPLSDRYAPLKSQEVEQLPNSSDFSYWENGMITPANASGSRYSSSVASGNSPGSTNSDMKCRFEIPKNSRNVPVDDKKDSNEDTDCNIGMLEFELMEDGNDDEVHEELETLNEGREAEQQKSKFHGSKHDAEKAAVELLASRACTAVELRKKLKAKGFPLSITDRVVRDFRSKGLINDHLYAEMFSRSRWSSLTWGPRKINQALQMKGVNQADARKAIKSVFEEGGVDGQESRGSLSKSSLDQLFVQASKRWQLSENLPSETRKARLVRWLQYRGFDWGVIGMIVKKLESQNRS